MDDLTPKEKMLQKKNEELEARKREIEAELERLENGDPEEEDAEAEIPEE